MCDDFLIEEIDTKDLLQMKLDSLKKNRENIPEDLLKTRYKKSYEALLKNIDELATKLMDEIMFHFLVEKYLVSEGHEMMKRLINKEKDSLKNCLYKEYSAQAYADICQSIYSAVIDKYLKEWRGWEGEEKYTLNPFNPKVFKVKAK